MSAQVQACRQSIDEFADRNVESDDNSVCRTRPGRASLTILRVSLNHDGKFCWALSIHLARRSMIGVQP